MANFAKNFRKELVELVDHVAKAMSKGSAGDPKPGDGSGKGKEREGADSPPAAARDDAAGKRQRMRAVRRRSGAEEDEPASKRARTDEPSVDGALDGSDAVPGKAGAVPAEPVPSAPVSAKVALRMRLTSTSLHRDAAGGAPRDEATAVEGTTQAASAADGTAAGGQGGAADGQAAEGDGPVTASVEMPLNEPDPEEVYFGIRRDPKMHIREGEAYQCVVPPWKGPQSMMGQGRGKEGVLVWTPPEAIEEDVMAAMDDYLKLAASPIVCGGGVHPDHALDVLMRNRYNLRQAVAELVTTEPDNPCTHCGVARPDTLRPDERRAYDAAFATFGKDFRRISRTMGKPLGAIVAHYYKWKKTQSAKYHEYMSRYRRRRDVRDPIGATGTDAPRRGTPSGNTPVASSPAPPAAPHRTLVSHDSKKCGNCGTRQTTQWRHGRYNEDLCNACGIYYTKNGMYRPTELDNDGRLSRGKKRPEDVLLSKDRERERESRDSDREKGKAARSKVPLPAPPPPSSGSVKVPLDRIPPRPSKKDGGPYVCITCGRSFHSVYSLNGHKATHIGGATHRGAAAVKGCSTCKATESRVWRKGPNNDVLCNGCGIHFLIYGTLRAHT